MNNMKRISKFVLAILMMSVCAVLPTQAQNAGSQKYEYDFNPHWFIQLQGGGQYTLGEVEFGKLLSPNVQFAVGYEFNPVVKGRFSINAWQSKAGIEGKWADLGNNGTPLYWKWKYVAPSVDVMFDLTNFLGGYKPEERKFSIGVFAGLGANIGFANDEAYDANNELKTRFNRLDPNEVIREIILNEKNDVI
jgi:OOP family OmpA-OmpF porin